PRAGVSRPGGRGGPPSAPKTSPGARRAGRGAGSRRGRRVTPPGSRRRSGCRPRSGSGGMSAGAASPSRRAERPASETQPLLPAPPVVALATQGAPMRRSRLRAGLLVVVAMALTGIGYRVWRNVAERTPRSLGELGVELIPEVAQHMQNFHRIKVKNGHMEWEIKADDAQYYQKQNEIVVRGPEVTIYTEQGVQRAWLTGKEAHLGLVDDGKEVGSMELRGDVVLWLDDLELRTDTATYDRD